jgi:hypothetical protein
VPLSPITANRTESSTSGNVTFTGTSAAAAVTAGVEAAVLSGTARADRIVGAQLERPTTAATMRGSLMAF